MWNVKQMYHTFACFLSFVILSDSYAGFTVRLASLMFVINE